MLTINIFVVLLWLCNNIKPVLSLPSFQLFHKHWPTGGAAAPAVKINNSVNKKNTESSLKSTAL